MIDTEHGSGFHPRETATMSSLLMDFCTLQSHGTELIMLGLRTKKLVPFSKHISDLRKKTNCKVGVLSRLRNLIP